MNLKMKQLPFILCFMAGVQASFAQLGFSHEVGIITGPIAFQSDFGVRQDFETNSGNSGYGIGIVHYINFAYRADCSCYTTDTYFNDHFKLRSEISWNTTKLNHFGQWVDESQTSNAADQLRAQSGEATNLDLGMQIEYYPLSIRSFQGFGYSFAPFVSLGAHFTAYNPKAATTYGDQDPANASNFYGLWQPGSIDPSSGSTWSVVTSVGVRYKLSIVADLMVDLRWQYFNSDWVDGLNHQLPSNKSNDWLTWFNFGYIYYLD
jgi:hypothetical protein